jgi:hypothetical protein
MSYWRKTAGWSAAFTGIAFILFAAYICCRAVERYYYIYVPTDAMVARHIDVRLEAAAWAIAVGLIVVALFMLKLSRKFIRP